MKTFESLVVVVEGEPLASTEIIAKGMKAKHKNVIALMRKHLDYFINSEKWRFKRDLTLKGVQPSLLC